MARTKEVFQGKSEVAHVWARQDQERGREGDSQGGRIFFEGPTIYSYGHHFPIATFFQRKGSEKVVLFTTRGYSSTTSAHIQAASGAVSHFRKIYCQSPTDAERGIHGDNMRDWEIRAQGWANKLAKATKPEKYLSEIAALRYQMEIYADYFKISKLSYKATGGKLTRFRYLMIETKEGGVKATAKEIAARKAYEKAQKERKAKAEADALEAFRNGEKDCVRGAEWTYLRFMNGQIETSEGIKIEFQEAKEYFSRLKSLQSKCENGDSIHGSNHGEFQGYKLRLVTADYFEIGCHKIQFSELDKVAKLAGFTMQAMTVEG